MKRALVCGAGGFIGGYLVKKLKREGYWVRGVDIKEHEFAPTQALWNASIDGTKSAKTSYSTGQADEFRLLDLREPLRFLFLDGAASLPFFRWSRFASFF